MKTLSCFATQNKYSIIGNLERIKSSNLTHVLTTAGHSVSSACMTDEKHCPIDTLVPIRSDRLIKNNIFISLRSDGIYFQCLNTNWILSTAAASNNKIEYTMQPSRIELPVETPDGSVIGLLQFAKFHSINRDPKSLNDQILHHHNILQKFQHQWNTIFGK